VRLERMAARAVLRVRELNAEITVETAMVTAELAEELSGDAADEGAGHEHGTHTRATAMTGPVTSSMALRAASRAPAVLEPALDVLHHHAGVIHHDADGQHQPEQRQVVQRNNGVRP